MPIDFSAIRPFKNSVNNAFEELCCQLARFEHFPEGSRFIRNGTPDGGVEAYWLLPNGEEHGWQAKYFDRLEKTQWQQLKESFETALRTHPKLTNYTICLPIDFPDAGIEDQKSLRDKWKEKVKQWECMAERLGRTVTFHHWGASELTSRLAEEKHSGRRYFWFGTTELSHQWFSQHLSVAVAAAGARYSSELNVELEIAKQFEALANSPSFKSDCVNMRVQVSELFSELMRDLGEVNLEQPETTSIRDNAEELRLLFEKIETNIPELSLFETLKATLQKTIESVLALQSRLSSDASGRLARVVSALIGEIDGILHGFLNSTMRLACVPSLLLCGDAGSGKTHLMCDVARRQIEAGQPAVVILGQLLGQGDLWTQLISSLQLNCSRTEFLGALESIAEAKSCRALILIDAINEASELNWRDGLPAILSTLSSHPYIGVAVSCRTTYEINLVRTDLVPNKLTRIEHGGFGGRLYEALGAFTAYYNLESLNVPPLDFEFGNPLFLKLFCQGLKNRGLRRPPLGHHGLQAIFNSLIDSVNEKLADPNELDFHRDVPIVRRALDKIVDAMLLAESNSLLIEEVQLLLCAVLPQPNVGYSRSLLRKLIDEGILAQGMYPRMGHEVPALVVYFAYERLADFHRGNRLLDSCNTEHDPEISDLSNKLGPYLASTQIDRNRGLLTALIVLVPERTSRELVEFMPDLLQEREIYCSAFLEALPWRAAKQISADCIVYLNDLLAIDDTQSTNFRARDAALNRVLLLTANPDHKLNSFWLHDTLIGIPMPERDAIWTIFLHRSWTANNYGSAPSVQRIIDWGWQPHSHETCACHNFGDEVVLLAGVTLTWCLTSSNRFVRDQATKALVCVLRNRGPVITSLLKKFESVDDPYVTERLMCSVYGAVLTSVTSDVHGFLKPIAQVVFEQVFAKKVTAHILIRDYARDIIEYALNQGCELEIEPTSIRPPYRTDPVEEMVPTWEELRNKYRDSSHSGLLLSLCPVMGDFSRYVLGVDSYHVGIQGWTNATDPFARCREQQVRELSESLRSRWRAVRDRNILASFDNATVGEFDDQSDLIHTGKRETESAPLGLASTDKFYESLTADEQTEFSEYINMENLKNRMLSDAESEASSQRLPLDFPARWIFLRVLSLGWTPQLFARFDDSLSFGDMRASHKAERIGKKYQWIAYHELFGRITDERPLRHNFFDGTERFDGPWDHFLRDIDPTFLCKEIPQKVATSWWIRQGNPIDDSHQVSGSDWVVDHESLPDFSSFTSAVRPDDCSEWMILEVSNTWHSSKRRFALPIEPARELSFSIGAYFVHADSEVTFAESMRQFNWTGYDVLSRDHYKFFLGEYGWAPSFIPYIKDAGKPFDEKIEEHSQIRRFRSGATGVPAVMRYYSEGNSFDCSRDEGCSACIPSAWFAYRAGLHWARKRFRFEDVARNVVAYDPSFEEPGPQALLVKSETIYSFLQQSNLRLFWILVGEKRLPQGSTKRQTAVFRQLLSTAADGVLKIHLRSFGMLGEPAYFY